MSNLSIGQVYGWTGESGGNLVIITDRNNSGIEYVEANGLCRTTNRVEPMVLKGATEDWFRERIDDLVFDPIANSELTEDEAPKDDEDKEKPCPAEQSN